MQLAVFPIGSMWLLGWPLWVVQGFKGHCFTCADTCYQLIIADQKHSYCLRIIGDSYTLSSLPLLCLVTRISILSGKLFPLNYFSVMVLVRECSFGWFPCSRVAMETSLWLMVSGTPLTFIGTSSQAHLFVMSSTNRIRVIDGWLFAYYWNPSKKLKGYLVLSDLHWQL